MEDRWVRPGKRGAGGFGIGHWVGRVWDPRLLRRELHAGILRRLDRRGVATGCVVRSPQLAGEEASERDVLGMAGQACGGERSSVIGEARRAKAGEDAEAEIERANESSGGEMHGASRDAKVRHQPECVWSEVRAQAEGKRVELVLGKAVE